MIAQRSDCESKTGFERKQACTCHPDDNPPVPCAGKFASSECRKAADVFSVTTRHARCVMRMPGLTILQARRRPIEFEGQLVKVMD